MLRLLFASLVAFAVSLIPGSSPAQKPAGSVSYYRDIRPILQKRCQGCHQPVSQGGKLIVTSFEAFKAGGSSGPSFVPGRPGDSAIMRYITGNPPNMPKGQKPLESHQVELIRQWIAEGAKNDTPVLKDPINQDHPPVYAAPPVISAVAYSPDGKTLAVSGFREILLHRADGSGLSGRLVGKSSRINSLTYSPDGKILAMAGGSPAQFGEVQFWDTGSNKLLNSVQLTYDELYGASFDATGTRLACGSADNSVRIVSVPDGKVLLKFDNHSDWTFATSWTLPRAGKGQPANAANENEKNPTNRVGKFDEDDHILSTGRDKAIKLIVAKTGSFVDDINTFTTAYRCMARHPKENSVLVGGEDGIPRLYQVFRTKPRTMNQEDHNLIRAYEPLGAPVNCLAFSPDGTRFAIGGEAQEVRVYGTADGSRVATLRGAGPVTFSVSFSPDGQSISAGGLDGRVRLYNSNTGALLKAFVPAPVTNKAVARKATKLQRTAAAK
jgi:WD40 repeat protein